MKIKFRVQTTANIILERPWKLVKKEEYKKVWIQRDLNKKKRVKLSKLYKESKEKTKQEQM